MTPSASLGMRNQTEQTSVAPNNLYNSISANGMTEPNSFEQSQQPIEANPADTFLQQFSQAFEPFKSLLADPNYSFAQKEADLVKRSLENYMEAVVVGISAQSAQETAENP